MPDKLTYRQLSQRLHELGYSDTHRSLNGKPAWLFEHNRQKNATIYLPPMPLDKPVESMHLTGVRATLKAHGILQEQPEQFLFPLSAKGNE